LRPFESYEEKKCCKYSPRALADCRDTVDKIFKKLGKEVKQKIFRQDQKSGESQEDSRCKADILKIENKYVREVEREYQHQLNRLSEDLQNENNFNREGSML
jgi:hypothetical protein